MCVCVCACVCVCGFTFEGERGVRRAIEIICSEFKLVMALAGAASLPEIDKSFVARVSDFYSKL